MQLVRPRAETVARNLWASPVCFVIAAWLCFHFGSGPAGRGLAWQLYWAGWVLPAAALVWCLLDGRRFGVGPVFALVTLVAAGVLFELNHG